MKNDTQTHAANLADNAPTQHTPLPWRIGMRPGPMIYGPKGEQVADMRNETLMPEENTANTRLIVESVNSAPRLKRERDELLAAAQHLLLSINNEPALRRLIADSCPQASENLYNAIARIEKGGAS